MITSKQRAYLRSMSNKIETIVQIGKSGVTPEVTKSADEALESRELVKVGVLNNCMMEVREAAEMLRERTRSEIVSVVGGKFILYRQSKEKPVIELPKK